MTAALRTSLEASLVYPQLARFVSLSGDCVSAAAEVVEFETDPDKVRAAMTELTEAVKRLNQDFAVLHNTMRNGEG